MMLLLGYLRHSVGSAAEAARNPILGRMARGLGVRSSSRVRVFIMVRRLELNMLIILRKRMRRIRIVSRILQYKIGPMLG